jgi:hypothetical protein
MRKLTNTLTQLSENNFDVLNNTSMNMLKGGHHKGGKSKKSKKSKKSRKNNYGCTPPPPCGCGTYYQPPTYNPYPCGW